MRLLKVIQNFKMITFRHARTRALAHTHTHKNCVDKLKILDRLGELRTGNSFSYLFLPQYCSWFNQKKKNTKVYKLTNQYPQRGGTKAVLGTCPSCCLTLICLRERAVNGLYQLQISIYVALLGDSQIILRHFFWGHGDFVIIFLRVEGDT